MNNQPVGDKAKAFGASLRAFLLFFCALFSLRFWLLLFHEGGHALAIWWIEGATPRLLYAHTFFLNGYARPIAAFGWVHTHAAGPVVVTLCSLLIFILVWKQRSVALLPLVMFFPWAAMETGVNVINIGQMGDYYHIIRLTGLPEAVIEIPCLLLFFIGGFFSLLLMPLLGLGPKDWRVLIVLPAAVILWTIVGFVAARLVVPGTPIDVVYHEQVMNGIWQFYLLVVLLLGVIYLTLYRLIHPRLPSWLKSEPALLDWKDLRIPALSAAAFVIVGLILIH